MAGKIRKFVQALEPFEFEVPEIQVGGEEKVLEKWNVKQQK